MRKYLNDKHFNQITNISLSYDDIVKLSKNISSMLYCELIRDFEDQLVKNDVYFNGKRCVLKEINEYCTTPNSFCLYINMSSEEIEHTLYLIKKYNIQNVNLTTIVFSKVSNFSASGLTIYDVYDRTYEFFKQNTNDKLFKKIEPYIHVGSLTYSHTLKLYLKTSWQIFCG